MLRPFSVARAGGGRAEGQLALREAADREMVQIGQADGGEVFLVYNLAAH